MIPSREEGPTYVVPSSQQTDYKEKTIVQLNTLTYSLFVVKLALFGAFL